MNRSSKFLSHVARHIDTFMNPFLYEMEAAFITFHDMYDSGLYCTPVPETRPIFEAGWMQTFVKNTK